MINPKFFVFNLLFICSFIVTKCYADNALSVFSGLNKAGLVVMDAQGKKLMATRADKALIPASTTKLATAWMALKHWGQDYHFHTRFYFDHTNKILWIKGSGDPYLVSEELDKIAKNLKQNGLSEVKAIGLDTTIFQPDLLLPGTGQSNNPYDAIPSALAANFNTVYLKKINGAIVSGEQQTPITPYAQLLAKSFSAKKLRINTGPSPQNAEKYFAELLAAFLRLNSVLVENEIIYGEQPEFELFYDHSNTKTLGEIIQSMLKYSTNFVANQLILKLSSEYFAEPANAKNVKRYMESTLSRHFGWKNFSLADGAGLARSNRLSPLQLTELLQAFKEWKHLLPEIEPGIYAKTGTLSGVSALAGYFNKGDQWQPFAVVMNESVPYHLRNKIALELANITN